MHKRKMAAGILLAALMLYGCGEKEPDMDSETVEAAEALTSEVEVRKDGSIVETVVEDFPEEFYNGENLRNMILSEVENYNKGHGDSGISVDKLEQKNGAVTVQMKYPSAEVYSVYNTDEYNHMSFFSGTVSQAFDAGYSMDVMLQDPKGNESIGKAQLLEMGEQKIVISENPMRIRVDGRIQYTSGNVTVSGKDEAVLAGTGEEDAAEIYYIIYK